MCLLHLSRLKARRVAIKTQTHTENLFSGLTSLQTTSPIMASKEDEEIEKGERRGRGSRRKRGRKRKKREGEEAREKEDEEGKDLGW